MRFSNQGRLREQVRFLRRQFPQDGALPFSDILTDDFVRQAMAAVEGVWKDRIYTPLVTVGCKNKEEARQLSRILNRFLGNATNDRIRPRYTTVF